jgi:hypothetical protein
MGNGTHADLFLTSLDNYDKKYRESGKAVDGWAMIEKRTGEHSADPDVRHICIDFKAVNWWKDMVQTTGDRVELLGLRRSNEAYLLPVSESIYPDRLQADFFVGRENSITFPRCSGGVHFTRFENLVGM